MKLDKEYIQQLSDLGISQVAVRLGLTLHRGTTTCLWHADKHPSLVIDRRRNNCHCYACGATADTIGLVQKVMNCGFREACQWLSDNYSIVQQTSVVESEPSTLIHRREYPPDVAYLSGLVSHPYLNDQAQRFLYGERRIDPRVATWCRLSSINTPMPCYRGGRPFYDAPSLLIPYFDTDGRLLSVQSRYLGADKSAPRFRFPRNSNCRIYNQQILPRLRDEEPLYLAEGPSDCWALLSAGHKAIAIPSATTLRSDELVTLLTPFREHWHGSLEVYPDQDSAGESLYRKLLDVSLLLQLPLIRHQLPEGCKDFGAMWSRELVEK